MTHVILDCKNDACPIPLLKTSQHLEKLSSGEVMEVKTSYMCAVENIIEWAQKHQVQFWQDTMQDTRPDKNEEGQDQGEDLDEAELTVFLKKP